MSTWTIPQFAKSIREKFPGQNGKPGPYDDWSDSDLSQAYIEKYPVYKDHVETPRQAVGRALPATFGGPKPTQLANALNASTANQMFQQGQSLAHLKETDPAAYAQQAAETARINQPLSRRSTAVKAGTASALLDLANWGKGLAHLGVEGGDESPEVKQRLAAIRTATHKGAMPSTYTDTALSKETSTPERQLLSYLNQPNVVEALKNPSTIEWLLNKAPQLGGMMARLSAEGALTGPAAPFLDTFFSTYQQPAGQRLKQEALVAATMGLGKVGQKALGKAIPGTGLIARGAKNIATRTTMAGSMAGLTGLTGGSADQAKEQALFGFSMSPGKSGTPEAAPVEAPARPVRGLLGAAPPDVAAAGAPDTVAITTQFPTQPYSTQTFNTGKGTGTIAVNSPGWENLSPSERASAQPLKPETSFGALGVRRVPTPIAEEFHSQLGTFIDSEAFTQLHPIEQAELLRLQTQVGDNVAAAKEAAPGTGLMKPGESGEGTVAVPTNLQIGGKTVGVEHFKQVIRTHLESGETALVGSPVRQPLTLASFEGHTESPTNEPLRAGLAGERGVASGLPAGQMRVPYDVAAQHLQTLEKMTFAVGKKGPLTTPDGEPVLKKSFKTKSTYEQEMILNEINRLRTEIPKPIQLATGKPQTKGPVPEDPNAPLPEPGGSFLVNPKGVPNAPTPSAQYAASQEPPSPGNPSGSNVQPPPTQSNQTVQPPVPSSGPGNQASGRPASEGSPTPTQTPVGESEVNNATSGVNQRPNQGVPQGPNLSGNEGQVRQGPSGQTSSSGGTGEPTSQQGPIATPEALSGQDPIAARAEEIAKNVADKFKGQKGSVDPDLLSAPWKIAKKVADFVGGAKAVPKVETSEALPAPGSAAPFNDMSRVETITSNFKTANKVLANHPETESLIKGMERLQDKKMAWIGTSLRRLSDANRGINSLTGLSGLQGARLAGELATTQEPAAMQGMLGQLSPKFKIPYTQAVIDAAKGWAQFRDEAHAMFPPKAGPAGKNVGYIPRYLTQMESLVGDTDLQRGIHQIWDYSIKGGLRSVIDAFKANPIVEGKTGGSFDKFTTDPSSPYVRHRAGKITDLELDIRRIEAAYVNSAAKVIFDRPMVQNAKLQAMALPRSALREFATATIKNVARYDAHPELDRAWTAMTSSLLKTYSRSVLGLNPVVAGYHAYRLFTDVWPAIESKYLAQGAAEFGKNPLKAMQETARLGLIPSDVKPWSFKTLGERGNAILQLGSIGDYFSRSVGYQAYKAKYLTEGMSPEEATLRAITQTKNTTQLVDPIRTQRLLFGKGPEGGLIHLITQFKQQPTMIAEQWFDVAKNAFSDPSAFGKLATSIAGGLAIMHLTGYKAIHLAPSIWTGVGGGLGEFLDSTRKFGNALVDIKNYRYAKDDYDRETYKQRAIGNLEQLVINLAKDITPGGWSITRQIAHGKPGFMEPDPKVPKRDVRPRRVEKSLKDMVFK